MYVHTVFALSENIIKYVTEFGMNSNEFSSQWSISTIGNANQAKFQISSTPFQELLTCTSIYL